MKRFGTTTTPPQKPTDPAVYAATYWRSALRMATLRALVVIAAIMAIAAALGAVLLIEQAPAATAGLGLLAVVIAVFAISLNAYTTAVARATWYQLEQETGQDLDHDGYVGDPTRTVRVAGNGKREEHDILLDLPAGTAQRAPILRPFGISAPDLVSFLFEAKLNRGLQERQWLDRSRPYVLPSGQRVSQDMFRTLLEEFGKVGWATKTAGRWELTVDPNAVAEHLQRASQAQPVPSKSVPFSRPKP
jgi:hypothetical protein